MEAPSRMKILVILLLVMLVELNLIRRMSMNLKMVVRERGAISVDETEIWLKLISSPSLI